MSFIIPKYNPVLASNLIDEQGHVTKRMISFIHGELHKLNSYPKDMSFYDYCLYLDDWADSIAYDWANRYSTEESHSSCLRCGEEPIGPYCACHYHR